MYSNEMNMVSTLDKKLQYDFFLNSIVQEKILSLVTQRRYKNLDVVKSYYGYSNEKARQVLGILNKKQNRYHKI